MRKKRGRNTARNTGQNSGQNTEKPAGMQAFSFGDAVPVLDKNDFWGWLHSAFNGHYYEPPVSPDGPAKALTSNAHHQSAIGYKVNVLASHFIPNAVLSRQDFKRLALDYLVFGNAYVERRTSRLGNVLALRPALARWCRIKKDGNVLMLLDGEEYNFPDGEVLHLQEPDINQEIYGMPGYLGAMQSALLNESATLFRRKYYLNGSHAGFIMYCRDAKANMQDIDAIRKSLKETKGTGNFKNLFLYSPGGEKDGIQIIPLSEVMAKDEFFNMKNVTRDDVLAAHRVPPQLLGIVPANGSSFGSVDDAARIFFQNEINPLMTAFETINEWVGKLVIAFTPYSDT